MKSKTIALVNRMKKSLVDKTSDVLSAPHRAYYGMKARKAAKDTQTLRTAKSYDNAPDFDNGAPTDAFKARSLADRIKRKYNK